MALSFLDNVDYRGKKPNFTRDLFADIATMAAFNENYLPNVFMACNEEDGQLYIFNRNNTVDATLGKWRPIEDGMSAYEVAVAFNGFEGTEEEWLESLKGADGIDGYSPTVVENANNTEDNYKLDITTETTSYTTPNLKGKQGVQGLQGTRGEKGDKGDTGLTGEKGADGVSPIVTENADNSDTIYKLDIVDTNGTHTTPNLIGRQGVQGLKGDKGDVGEKGEQGIQGVAGTDGVSPLITTNTANTEDVYKLDITDANGTFTTPNLVGRQGVQGIQGEKGEQGEQGIQGIQGIQGEKGEDGYPFLIYREYSSLDDFDPDHFPEIGLMFMIKAEDGQDNYPVYRYTGMVDTPYSFVTDLATSEGLKGEKGDKGDQGEQGIQGEKGADGITYTPVIGTVTTVGSTSDATADIVVDSVAKTATFNFAIPKGSNGAIGGKGDKGEKGDTGEKGDAGVDGITYTPTIGTVSTVDSASEASASVDIDTDNARATFNFSIPRGADGLQGIQGIQGLQGIQGEAGKDGEDGTTYVPNIGTVTTVSSVEEATANVELDNENKLATFNFNIPKGVGVKKVEFTSSTLGDVAGIASATDTYTITFTDESTTTYEVYNGKDCDVQIDDVNDPSETSVWSSKKTSDEIAEEVTGAIDTSLANYSIPLNLYMGIKHYLAIKINTHNMNYSFNMSDRSGNIYEGTFFSYNGSFSIQITKVNNSSTKNGYILGFRQYKVSDNEIYLVAKVSDYNYINGVINTPSILKSNIEILVNDDSTLWDKGTDIVVKELATMDKVESKYEEATLVTPVDWNTLNTKARYYVSGVATMTNAPMQQPFGELVVETVGSVCRVQKFFSFDGRLYMRRWTGSIWNDWYKFDGTAN